MRVGVERNSNKTEIDSVGKSEREELRITPTLYIIVMCINGGVLSFHSSNNLMNDERERRDLNLFHSITFFSFSPSPDSDAKLKK
jgi:hypothetical protein